MIPPHLFGALSAVLTVARTPDAADCPDAEGLTERVERIVHEPMARSSATASTVVRVGFTRTEDAYQATIRLEGAREGERALRDEGPTCEALADAVAVTTALLFDASAPRQPLVETSDASKPASAPRLSWWLSARLGAGAGLVGGPTWLTGVAVEASVQGLGSFELGGAWTGSRTSELGNGSVRVHLWYLDLGAFRSLTGERARLGPCLLLLGGQSIGAGEGYPLTSSASLMWWAVGGGIRGDIELGPAVRVGVRALAVVPTRKQSFSIGFVGTPYESSRAATVVDLGFSVKAW